MQFTVFLSKPQSGKILLRKLQAKMLSPNQIEGFFDHQYLWKETINFLDFLHRDSYQERYVRLLLLLGCGQACPSTSKLYKLLRDEFSWYGGGMVTLKIIQRQEYFWQDSFTCLVGVLAIQIYHLSVSKYFDEIFHSNSNLMQLILNQMPIPRRG